MNESCCLPCPLQQWIYPESLATNLQSVSKAAVLSIISTLFLLLTWMLLPSIQSHRHYLSIGLTFSMLLTSAAFIVPLSVHTNPCTNTITPANMFTNSSCGWSGALLQVGSLATAIWVLLRALWLHARVVWDVTPSWAFAMASLFVGKLRTICDGSAPTRPALTPRIL